MLDPLADVGPSQAGWQPWGQATARAKPPLEQVPEQKVTSLGQSHRSSKCQSKRLPPWGKATARASARAKGYLPGTALRQQDQSHPQRASRPGGRPRTGGPPHNFCRPSGYGRNEWRLHLSPTVKNSGVNYHAPSSSKADFQLNLDRPGWKGIVRPAEEWRCELANEVHIIDMVQHVERISRNFHVSFAVLSPIEELPRQVHIQ